MLERYHRELMNFLTHQLRDRDTAADLAQESCVRVLAAQDAGRPVLDLRALLYRVARNLVIDHHRRSQHRRHEDLDTLEESGPPSAPGHLEPEQRLWQRQQARALMQAIESLPPRCREAFVLNRFEHLSHAEVAERMGISRNMVAQPVARALLDCRDALARLESGAGGGRN